MCMSESQNFIRQAPQVMPATAQVRIPYLLGLDKLFTISGFVIFEV